MIAKHFAVAALVLFAACTAPESVQDTPEGAAPAPAADASPADGWYESVRVDGGTGATREQYLRAVQAFSLPEWANARARREGHTRTFALAGERNPFYQSADFDGDGQLDVAVWVVRRATGQEGILLLHGGGTPTAVIGAGESFGNGGMDFRWMTHWRVHPARDGAARGHELEVAKFESGAGTIFWDGRAYQWRQTGD